MTALTSQQAGLVCSTTPAAMMMQLCWALLEANMFLRDVIALVASQDPRCGCMAQMGTEQFVVFTQPERRVAVQVDPLR